MTKHIQKFSFVVIPILIISIFISLLIYIYCCIKADMETSVISRENVTKVTDVEEIKKRMKFHGCLVCWKDSKGTWWFNRDNKQCKLR